jgi:hypothetical protein
MLYHPEITYPILSSTYFADSHELRWSIFANRQITTKRSRYPIMTTLIEGDNSILKHHKLNLYQLSDLGRILNHHKLNLSCTTFYLYIMANRREAIIISQPTPQGAI